MYIRDVVQFKINSTLLLHTDGIGVEERDRTADDRFEHLIVKMLRRRHHHVKHPHGVDEPEHKDGRCDDAVDSDVERQVDVGYG